MKGENRIEKTKRILAAFGGTAVSTALLGGGLGAAQEAQTLAKTGVAPTARAAVDGESAEKNGALSSRRLLGYRRYLR